MNRRSAVHLHAVILSLIMLALLAGCGTAPSAATNGATSSAAAQATAQHTVAAAAATTRPAATGGTASGAGTAQAAAPTPIPRSNNPKDLILATTTSTQDSGLLDVLIPLFEQKSVYHVKTVAVGSGAAIALGQRGEADVVLAHAPDNEKQFVAAGTGVDRQLVMFNDFILVGPPADPAKVQGKQNVLDALRAIAASKATFVSRGDNSGTNQLEVKLWKGANITPKGQGWYVESGTGMGQTLQITDQRGAYTLSDRATYLAFKSKIALPIDVEKDPQLLNIYHVIAVNPERFPQVNRDGAQAFEQFLLSSDTQQTIGNFGRDKYGQALFTPCAQNSCHLQTPDG